MQCYFYFMKLSAPRVGINPHFRTLGTPLTLFCSTGCPTASLFLFRTTHRLCFALQVVRPLLLSCFRQPTHTVLLYRLSGRFSFPVSDNPQTLFHSTGRPATSTFLFRATHRLCFALQVVQPSASFKQNRT